MILASSWAVDIDEYEAYAPAALNYLRGGWSDNFQHPMFVKLLFAASILLFGAEGRVTTFLPWLSDSIGAIRLVSIILSTATCLVVYYLVKKITDNHAIAIVPCILLAFDPISIAGGSYGILDPGMTFFLMASIYFFYRHIENCKFRDLMISAVFFGLSVASKYLGVIGFFIIVGIWLWKKKSGVQFKSIIIFLFISIVVFFVVQPFLWSNTLNRLYLLIWLFNKKHILEGHLIKIPGNPFIIPHEMLQGDPWPIYGETPLASKPDFFADTSQAVQSPWWYVLYIQAMYSTPFQLIIYPCAILMIFRSFIRRSLTDIEIIAGLMFLIPTIFFAVMSVRLSQYAIISSALFVILSSVIFLHLGVKNRKYFLLLTVMFHVGWVLYILLTSVERFSGWEFYITPLTSIIAEFFHQLWLIGFR
jgi:4-amino-4-deoxy-L-arabinose transferase-like glycosyltransferase